MVKVMPFHLGQAMEPMGMGNNNKHGVAMVAIQAIAVMDCPMEVILNRLTLATKITYSRQQ